MSLSQLELDISYARNLTYDASGKVNNSNLAKILTRGVSAAVDISVARDGENFLDSLVERYGLEFGIKAAWNRANITFHPIVDGRKTAETLRAKGVILPEYVGEIILCGKTTVDVPAEKFQIFYVGDDPNIGGDVIRRGHVSYFADKLQLPIEYLLRKWDFSLFVNPEKIREKLQQALTTKFSDPNLPQLAKKISYNANAAEEAFEMMGTEGVVKNLFGDEWWRANAEGYGRALLNAVLEALKVQKSEGALEQKEFLEKLNLLLSYYSFSL